MSKYYIVYKDFDDQAADFRDAQRALEGFEGRLNSIADSMDGRDGSMAALKQQLKGCSRNIPGIANRVNAIAVAITEITVHTEMRKRNAIRISKEKDSQNSSNASAGAGNLTFTDAMRDAGVTITTINGTQYYDYSVPM